MKLYYKLIKPGISYMQIVSASIAYFYAMIWMQSAQWISLNYLKLVIGTFLVSAASGTLNQVLEKNLDILMPRTKNRPIASNKISVRNAIIFASILLLLGSYCLYSINTLVVITAYLTVILYLFVYTPLKTKTWLNTYVGAIPGALPIVGGWLAATPSFDFPIIPLVLVLFSWQHPHFYALAVMYKDDYAKANMKMLPVIDKNFIMTSQQTLLFSILTVIGSLWLVLLNLSGVLYAITMSILGILFIGISLFFVIQKNLKSARLLFFSSIIYLPLWFIIALIDMWISK